MSNHDEKPAECPQYLHAFPQIFLHPKLQFHLQFLDLHHLKYKFIILINAFFTFFNFFGMAFNFMFFFNMREVINSSDVVVLNSFFDLKHWANKCSYLFLINGIFYSSDGKSSGVLQY